LTQSNSFFAPGKDWTERCIRRHGSGVRSCPARTTDRSFLRSHEPGSPWRVYLEQIERVLPHLGRLAGAVETLRRPKRIMIVDVPIETDGGRMAHFEGYRVQHNLSRGPGKGGVRYHPDVGLDEVMALAAWMTIKTQPTTCPSAAPRAACASIRDLVHEGTRAAHAALYQRDQHDHRPGQDIPAPDVNTNEQTMAWMMDTYSMNVGHTTTGVVTGKPLALGGSLGRNRATGQGVFYIAAKPAGVWPFPSPGARCDPGLRQRGPAGGRAVRRARRPGDRGAGRLWHAVRRTRPGHSRAGAGRR